ncbi:hypothetical protein GH714_032005 [Hevea brasiliensis]|uniref:Uncharacterized protein n=1 Tax=Hevea brasiliensis TaxID=3981 RepID=A0A6A6LG46_HEVBR|nr:hypothetical protein GH714_032005 [Hevea brasiliensis]
MVPKLPEPLTPMVLFSIPLLLAPIVLLWSIFRTLLVTTFLSPTLVLAILVFSLITPFVFDQGFGNGDCGSKVGAPRLSISSLAHAWSPSLKKNNSSCLDIRVPLATLQKILLHSPLLHHVESASSTWLLPHPRHSWVELFFEFSFKLLPRLNAACPLLHVDHPSMPPTMALSAKKSGALSTLHLDHVLVRVYGDDLQGGSYYSWVLVDLCPRFVGLALWDITYFGYSVSPELAPTLRLWRLSCWPLKVDELCGSLLPLAFRPLFHVG